MRAPDSDDYTAMYGTGPAAGLAATAGYYTGGQKLAGKPTPGPQVYLYLRLSYIDRRGQPVAVSTLVTNKL